MIYGKLEGVYLSEAATLPKPQSGMAGHVEWECPSNIALIKYWGNKPVQIPVNPSLSFTLTKCITRMSVDFGFTSKPEFSLDFVLDGKPNTTFAEKISAYLLRISPFMPFLKSIELRIVSSNSFPHSTGIASSASSFAALSLALCSMEQQIRETFTEDKEFYRKASFLARLGSGSASRSVYGGAVLWGQTPKMAESSDEAATPVSGHINPEFMNYRDSILVVYTGAKQVSSSKGHQLMEKHPFTDARILQANHNLAYLLQIMKKGNRSAFVDVIENEALTLHALMMSSDPGYLLLQPNTLEIIREVRKYRELTGLPLGFTLDAGANVHLLYPSSIMTDVHGFIGEHLKQYCENGQVIHDQVGNGPVKVS